MTQEFEGLSLRAADVLLPQNCEYMKWAVVACDQYTSQPDYWQRVEELVGNAPSALRLVLPESCLDGPNVETDIIEINNTMSRYLRHGVFREIPNALIYVERTLHNGKVRKGLIGRIDLERYDYEPDRHSEIRATEGVILSRIPPRVAVRKNAALELPHVVLLYDDPKREIIEKLADRKDRMSILYDFDLMENGGHVAAWKLDEESAAQVSGAFLKLFGDQEATRKRYGLGKEVPVFQFAVGDGNHSLATAKECYEYQKKLTPPEEWASLPSRWTLCEVENLYDDAVEFEPIHRVVFGVDQKKLLMALRKKYPSAKEGKRKTGHELRYVSEKGEGVITVTKPTLSLPVATLQAFLDEYVLKYGGSIDYIHGEEAARELGKQPGNMAFLLEAMPKEELFPTIIKDNVLPRKTFSMGEANDKRYYLEARKIR